MTYTKTNWRKQNPSIYLTMDCERRGKIKGEKKRKGLTFLTLGLLTGELAVSSKASSTKAPLVLFFLKLKLYLKLLLLLIGSPTTCSPRWSPADFFTTKEAASETSEELLSWSYEKEPCSYRLWLWSSSLFWAKKSSKYMVQPLSSKLSWSVVFSLDEEEITGLQLIEFSISEKEVCGLARQRHYIWYVFIDRADRKQWGGKRERWGLMIIYLESWYNIRGPMGGGELNFRGFDISIGCSSLYI